MNVFCHTNKAASLPECGHPKLAVVYLVPFLTVSAVVLVALLCLHLAAEAEQFAELHSAEQIDVFIFI